MDDFKNSTKTMYSRGGPVGTKGAAKVAKVMREFREGSLHSGKHGREVKDRKQAVAIALSEGRRMKKANGGLVTARPVDKAGRRITDEELATPERILRKSGRADPYEVMPTEGPAVKPRRVIPRAAPEAAEPQTALMRRLTEKPRRGPQGAGFERKPRY